MNGSLIVQKRRFGSWLDGLINGMCGLHSKSLNLAHCCQANAFGYSRGRQILECNCGGEYR
ncbi:unnamed protein product [Prunus armeniaca]|uniref:Uncharacterized protein n=1 Tax=Prunus armeniaca TaxID=36596 RepID=A0A6J5XTI4_PRUAR|nr:unnamed protein product [Prunus armeniaca]